MIQSLMVNFKQNFVERMTEDAGPHALVTPSYVQGLRHLSDPSLPLSGIFLNPNDSSYSAIRFLTLALIHRPMTPVFLLDEEGEFSSQNISFLKERFKIQGTFQGKKNFFELMQNLKIKLPQEFLGTAERSVIQSQHPGYLAVPVTDFLYAKNYAFNLFVEDETGAIRFFAMEGSEVDLEYLSFLHKKTPWVYFEEESLLSRKASFQEMQQRYLEEGLLSLGWRSAEMIYRAKGILEEIAKGGVSSGVVNKTFEMVSDLQLMVSSLTQVDDLKKFIAQAAQCDRTILAATYSILLCNRLKMKSTTIIESIGLASFFQDIALFNTPFGNLSATHPTQLSEEEMTYYRTHPILGASFMAKVKEIPEVVCQLILQQHERKDRTGFPNQIGGVQVQPLAELLSFINAQIDSEPEIERHYSEHLVKAWASLNVSISK